MKRYPARILALIIIISLLFTNALAASNNRKNISSLDTGVTATVNYGDWLEGTQSTFDISLSNIPADAGLSNGIYTGWCIQPWITGELHNKPAKLYTSLSNALPSDLAGLPWNEINYVLNHKIRGDEKSDLEFYKDVQTAIVLLLGVTNPEFGITPEAQLMFDNAIVHSEYVPGNGDIVAVIVYSDGMSEKRYDRIQETIIEVRLTLPPTNTPTFTPTGTLPTNTATNTPTFTPTGTLPTNTPTNTPTFTATGTLPTNTPTNTPTFTATGTLPTNTPTNTPTFTATGTLPTNTPTNTPTVCLPTVVIADFSQIASGSSIEGMGAAAPSLNIDAKGTAVKIVEGSQPVVYGAGVGNTVLNGGISTNRGFTDLTTKAALQPHLYTFTFAPGTSVSNFSLHMLDFGDLNPLMATATYASMTAYNANGFVVAKQELSYSTTAPNSYISPQYGNLITAGDAIQALPGQPGNWTWNVSGSGIVKVVLEFGSGFDPNIGFDLLSFRTECLSCQGSITTPDFPQIAPGSSIEGMGAVTPSLNIDAKGTAVKIVEGSQPVVYGAGVGNTVLNGGISTNRGFTDLTTKAALQPHLYTFTFAPGTSVSNFSLHMLDFGDLNPLMATATYASMTAYNANGFVVAKQELSYSTTAPNSYISPQYGNLITAGDAIQALPGQPGNWTWNVSGSGIVKVVLEFGSGFDPNIGFDLLSFRTECQ